MSDISRRFEVRRTPSLNVRLPSGRVTVAEGSADEVLVGVSGRLADRFVIEQSGPEITVRLDDKRSRGGHEVEIVAPPSTDLWVQTSAADITCSGSFGDVRLVTASGDLRLGGAGDVDVKTASGDVFIERSEGRLRARTASGDVHVDEAAGDVSVVTASGDVGIDDVLGDVSAKTASGRISLDQFRGSTVTLKTVSGGVRVAVVSGRTVSLDLQSLTGSISLPEERDGSGTGGPDLRIKVKTVTGDIAIRVVD